MNYSQRMRRLQESLEGSRLDALIVTHLPNVRYLCGFTGSAAVLAVTDRQEVARCLSLYRSVQPLVVDVGSDVDTTRRRVGDALLARGVVAPGDIAVLVSISQDLGHQSANYLKLERLGTPGV